MKIHEKTLKNDVGYFRLQMYSKSVLKQVLFLSNWSCLLGRRLECQARQLPASLCGLAASGWPIVGSGRVSLGKGWMDGCGENNVISSKPWKKKLFFFIYRAKNVKKCNNIIRLCFLKPVFQKTQISKLFKINKKEFEGHVFAAFYILTNLRLLFRAKTKNIFLS